MRRTCSARSAVRQGCVPVLLVLHPAGKQCGVLRVGSLHAGRLALPSAPVPTTLCLMMPVAVITRKVSRGVSQERQLVHDSG